MFAVKTFNAYVLAKIVLCLAVSSVAVGAQAGSVEAFLKMRKASSGPGTAMCRVGLYSAGELMAFNGMELEKLPLSKTDGRGWLATTGLCTRTENTVPDGAALTKAFVNWAETHPERSQDDQVSGIIKAFSSTWPCKK